MFGFPLLRSIPQRVQDVVDCRSPGRILIPTRRRHLPQFFGVASGDGEGRSLRPPTMKDMERYHHISVPVEWGFFRQDLGSLQRFGLIWIVGSSLRGWSSPSNICPTVLWDQYQTFLDPAVPVDTSAGRRYYQPETREMWWWNSDR